MQPAINTYSRRQPFSRNIEICYLRSLNSSLRGKWTPEGNLKNTTQQERQKGREICFPALSSRKQFCHQPFQLHHLQNWVFRRQSRCSKAVSFVNIDEKCELKMWPHSVSYLRVTAIRNIDYNLSWECRDLFSVQMSQQKTYFQKVKWRSLLSATTQSQSQPVQFWSSQTNVANSTSLLEIDHSLATGEIKGWVGWRSGSKQFL